MRILSRISRFVVGRAKATLKRVRFRGSSDHWEKHYSNKGTSGAGSYGHLAEFKAEILNGFVTKHRITSVAELGSGDGNQLTLAEYPDYTGYDVAQTAVTRCQNTFAGDSTKRFVAIPDGRLPPKTEPAELALSLDVIFHLVEDAVFDSYMRNLFSLGTRFVIIYASDRDNNPILRAPHIWHRRFTPWIEKHAPNWELKQRIPNRYPFQGDAKQGSHSDFFIYAPKE